MDFGKISNWTKETIDKGKKTIQNIPDTINQNKYNKDYWNKFVIKCVNDKNIDVTLEDGIHNYTCIEDSYNSFDKGLYKDYSILFSGTDDVKLTFTKTDGKVFEFRTPEYIFRYDNGNFIFHTNEEKFSDSKIITNSVKSVEELTSFNISTVKYILADTETITDNLFGYFLTNPLNFRKDVMELWTKLEKPFEIDFRSISKKDFSLQTDRFFFEDNKEVNMEEEIL